MNIFHAAIFAGVFTKTARHYCDIGLTPVRRGDNGYRVYSEKDAVDLRFVARARVAGFSLPECRHLLTLLKNNNRASADVLKMVLEHIEKIEKEIQNLNKMRAYLMNIATACPAIKRLIARFWTCWRINNDLAV